MGSTLGYLLGGFDVGNAMKKPSTPGVTPYTAPKPLPGGLQSGTVPGQAGFQSGSDPLAAALQNAGKNG